MAARKSTKKSTKKPARKSAGKRAPARKAKAAARPASKGLAMKSASPGFTVNDLEKSLAWYRDVLGFKVASRWEHDGVFMGAELEAGDVLFMIGQDDWKKGRDRKKGEGFRMYCETRQDVDALARGIQERGGVLDSPPADQSWGSRDFSITDPDGFKITIGRPLR